ncbi:MAG: glycoside hydrolase family 13 protein, partial [Acutalibacteraceae bacterium]
MEHYPFDSRNPLYRNKSGALAEGETLRLRLLLHHDAHVHAAFLLFRDDRGETVREARMTAAGELDGYRFYECEITPSEGLYWYQFRYTSDYGEFHVVKYGHSLGIVANEGDWWQLTVYERGFTTPNWLDGGLIYQIFPDRFYNSGVPKAGVPD